MCSCTDCGAGPCIYDEDVQQGMFYELLAEQVREGYFDDE